MIRLFDIFFSLVGIIISLPISVLIIIVNSFETGGRPFFLQERVGKNGKLFKLIKFRTMYYHSSREQLITIGKKDKRITRIGSFLRKFKIDEVPQLINVLTGDMSLVGPRPEVLKYVNLYSDNQKIILSVRPGLTDFASIQFLNEAELLGQCENPEKEYIEKIMPLKMELNKKFLKNPSIKNYFFIILLTAKHIFFRGNSV